MLDSDASSAKTLTLVAIKLQSLFFILGLSLIITFLAVILGTAPGAGGATASFPVMGLFGTVFAFGFAIGFIWILLEYFLVYKKLSEERVTEAETPALVLGVITLLFGGIITGILMIIAYVKIRDSIARHPPAYQQQPYQQQQQPPSF